MHIWALFLELHPDRRSPCFQKMQILTDLFMSTGGHLQGQALSKLGNSFCPAINLTKFDNFINTSEIGCEYERTPPFMLSLTL